MKNNEAKVEQTAIEESAAEPKLKKGDPVLFHQYGETKEHRGKVIEAPESGKLTIKFDDELGELKINPCYLKKA